ncbi:Ldh family oxidoreductase [Microbacterium keratanolyticum]
MSVRMEQAELLAVVERVLWAQRDRAGVAWDIADVTAEDVIRASRWLVSAEQLGLGAFGVSMLIREIDRLGASPAGEQTVYVGDSSADATVTIDAARIPGPIALAVAVRRLLAASVDTASRAIRAVSIENVGALGILGLAARDVAEQGLLALLCARAPAMVAPWGGNHAAIGTNPLALAAPRRDRAPLVLDYATSPISMAALKAAASAGEQLDAPGGFTAEGARTTDATEVATIAPDSRIASLTGLAVELLTRSTTAQRPEPTSSTRSALLIAIDPHSFGAASFPDSVADLAAGWAAAGGHVPRRFDEGATTTAVEIDETLVRTLRGYADEGATADRSEP